MEDFDFMQKKGQITLFIVIGLIILITFFIIFTFYLRLTDTQSEPPTFETITTDVRYFVDRCIESTALDGAYLIGSQGGYYEFDPPNYYFTIDPYNLGTEYSFGYAFEYQSSPQNILISIQKMEEEYENFMKKELIECIDDFSIFSYLPHVTFDTKEPFADVTIEENKSFVKVDYPIIIKIEGTNSVSKIAEFNEVTIPVRLGHLRNITDKIIDLMIAMAPGYDVPMSYLDSHETDNIRIVYGTSDKTMYYMIYDGSSRIKKNNEIHKPRLDNMPYFFNFALNFSGYP